MSDALYRQQLGRALRSPAPPKRGPEWWERIVDTVRGPRSWTVRRINVLTGYHTWAQHQSHPSYGATTLLRDLREREARAYARRLQPLPPVHFDCRCMLRGSDPAQ